VGKRHEPGPCTGCGASLAGAPEVGMERRQVFDLPPMTVQVTEHQLIARRCTCGTTTCGTAPEGVGAPVQYGPRVTAIVLYLYVGQFLSKKRTAQALAELFGTPVSDATVAAMTARAAAGLDGFLTEVADRIAAAEVAGFDETGLRVAGQLAWVHCARTGKYTLITCHPKRGRKGINDAGVLTRFRGVAVHDAWAPYDTYLDAAHQLCCAHYPDLRIIPTFVRSALVCGGARAGVVGIITGFRGTRAAGRGAGSGRGGWSAGWSGSALALSA
jgi:transposase